MTDYRSLIATAVEGTNDFEARSVIYERARAGLFSILNRRDPPLADVENIRERLALERAIREVEAERHGRRRETRLPETKTPFDGGADPAAPNARLELSASACTYSDVNQIERGLDTGDGLPDSRADRSYPESATVRPSTDSAWEPDVAKEFSASDPSSGSMPVWEAPAVEAAEHYGTDDVGRDEPEPGLGGTVVGPQPMADEISLSHGAGAADAAKEFLASDPSSGSMPEWEAPAVAAAEHHGTDDVGRDEPEPGLGGAVVGPQPMADEISLSHGAGAADAAKEFLASDPSSGSMPVWEAPAVEAAEHHGTDDVGRDEPEPGLGGAVVAPQPMADEISQDAEAVNQTAPPAARLCYPDHKGDAPTKDVSPRDQNGQDASESLFPASGPDLSESPTRVVHPNIPMPSEESGCLAEGECKDLVIGTGVSGQGAVKDLSDAPAPASAPNPLTQFRNTHLELELVRELPLNPAAASAAKPTPALIEPLVAAGGPDRQAGDPTLNRDIQSKTEIYSERGKREASVHPRLEAMVQAARYHGVDLDPKSFRPGGSVPSAAELSTWAQDSGLWSRAVRMSWKHLLRLNDTGPVVLLFTDGTAGLFTGADVAQNVILLKSINSPLGAPPTPVDELRLSQVWAGETVLLRASRLQSTNDAHFNLRWLVQLVLHEHHALRDVGLASLTISFLTIFPPLLVMATVNKVLQFNSVSTLALLSSMLVVIVVYETLLNHARRHVVSVVGARLDARLNLHVFNRLLNLPLDYFERHPAGETMYRIGQVYRVREFLTGRLLATFLDLISFFVLLPFLFYLNVTLAWIVLASAVAIFLIILAFLKPLRDLYGQVTVAETWKSAALGETIAGIKTVKALALEPQRRALWDERIAEAGKWHLAFDRLANWPQTLVNPIERFMVLGVMMVGAYLAISEPSGYMVGGLFAFMLLSARVAQPLVSLARLVQDYEEVGAAIGEAGLVLNRPLEVPSAASGLRPKISGSIAFQDVSFTYAGTKLPALDRLTFDVPAGTMLGIVGRSGSGKSTITRLLQGINRDYQGFIKLDGSDLRDFDLRHLRQSLGVVLQSNFLFRGSIRDNIIAGRPGLTLADAVHAARVSGAEEFIERMPNGYDTYIEEGSPNLSGGQAQRLAIARALIHDPRVLILDEATSALDPESEAVVTANLLRIARGRTMIIVSHRLSSLIECDKILVLDQGKMSDVGPHPELLERCALYRQLWAQQNRYLDNQGSPRKPVIAPRLVPRS